MKETFYFSHDYNCRSDEKIKKLTRKHGLLGYGIFWAIIEDLYNNANSLEFNCTGIAYDIREDENIIKSVIEDFGLFNIIDDHITSDSVGDRLNKREKRSEKAKDSANARWGTKNQKANDIIFYVLEIYNENEKFIKCGITSNSISRRFSGKLKLYKYNILYQCDMTTNQALELENVICEKCENYAPKNKFGGYLECYSIESKANILKILKENECEPNTLKKSKRKESKLKKEKEKKIKDEFLENIENEELRNTIDRELGYHLLKFPKKQVTISLLNIIKKENE